MKGIIVKVLNGENHITKIKELIIEYTDSLGRNLDFQDLGDELKNFPGKYMPPNGKLLVALTECEEVIGCVAYSKHSEIRCEMKRLYVKPEYRKLKVGEKLVKAIIEEAKEDGFKEMVLDTLSPMKSAIGLYKKLGFIKIDAYYDNPMDDVIYMKLDL